MAQTQCNKVHIQKIATKRRNILSLATASALALNSDACHLLKTNIHTHVATAFTPAPIRTSKYFRSTAVKNEESDDMSQPTNDGKKRKLAVKCEKMDNIEQRKQQPTDELEAKHNPTHTQSFKAQYNPSVQIHTLVLGTHPSITSLAKTQYFGYPTNAFWWIAGDCLGFRRASGYSPTTGKPYRLASHLCYGEDRVIPYEEQVEVFTSYGFALWDLLKSCSREGSLDNDIQEEVPNPIDKFCRDHPTINRIVMANGAKQCDFFNRHFKDWWIEGGLRPGDNHDLSQKAFGKWAKKKKKIVSSNNREDKSIEVYCMPGVSPAAARISYEAKRDTFRNFCFNPGLLDHKRLSSDDSDSSIIEDSVS